MHIKLYSNYKDSKQEFHLHSKESWEQAKNKFPKQIHSFFSAQKNEFFIHITSEKTIFLLGTSDLKNTADFQGLGNLFSTQYRKNFAAESTSICSFNHSVEEVEEFITGLFLGTYNYPFKEDHPFWDNNFELHAEKIKSNSKLSNEVLALCKGQFAAMDWLNKPANFKKTHHISEFLQSVASTYNFSYKAFNKTECEELGLNAFLAVNQGSSMDCAFTIIEYKSSSKDAKTVGLIGKCVLFDTGGISIKPSDNMHYMKSDMGGATAVIGTLIAAAELNLPINITAILPITDNAVSASAYLPSDVIKAYNGKTIEVLNTDAEGRMTLADALSYHTSNFQTDVLIDLATLTGSSVRMFGDTCATLFSNNESLISELTKSGNLTNQKLWNMPMWDVWKDDFISDVADFKNISSKPFGDCIIAAKFLEQFIGTHPNWAHLDIAGVAFGKVNYSKEKAATGYGVQLLLNYIKNFS